MDARAACCALSLAVLLGSTGCGEDEDHVNRARPAASIGVAAAIIDGRVLVSPRSVGAGPIRLIVTNQTDTAQRLTFETVGDVPGLTRTTGPIDPSGTATLEVDAREGEYSVSTADDAIEPADVTVGPPRRSAQDQLLQP